MPRLRPRDEGALRDLGRAHRGRAQEPAARPRELKPSPLDRIRRTATRIRSRGPQEVAGVARDRVREWVRSGDELIVLVRPASAEAPVFRYDPQLTVRRATIGDADAYARSIGTDSAATFRRRLSATTHCFLVHLGDRLVHASWVTTSAAWTREIRGYLVPPQGDAYVYESFTSPGARGRGVYPIALAGVCEWAAQTGVASVWVAVERDNAASFKAIRKAGFERSFSIRYARRLGRLTVDVDGADGLVVPEVVRSVEG